MADDEVDRRLEALLGERLVRTRIDPAGFAAFRARYTPRWPRGARRARRLLDRAGLGAFGPRYPDPRPWVDAEKVLEYYISYTWLDLGPSDVFMDVAAQDCPFAFFVRDTVGCRVYRQDLYHLRQGVHGADVGGDATALPFRAGALSKLALHNSFEHFEGDADLRFIREAARVLRPGGKVCIVPLFVGEEYRVDTESGWIDARGKKHLWGVGARFARVYDPPALETRILGECGEFDVTVYLMENAPELDPACYVRHVLMLERRDTGIAPPVEPAGPDARAPQRQEARATLEPPSGWLERLAWRLGRLAGRRPLSG
jgi:SAM-dependent methyltransferase